MWHDTICVKFKNHPSHLKTWIRKKIITLGGEWVWLKQDPRELSWCQGFSVFISSSDSFICRLSITTQGLYSQDIFSHPCALKKHLYYLKEDSYISYHTIKSGTWKDFSAGPLFWETLGRGQNLCKDVRMASWWPNSNLTQNLRPCTVAPNVRAWLKQRLEK